MPFKLNLPSFDTLLINSSAVFDKNWLASDNVLVRYLNVMRCYSSVCYNVIFFFFPLFSFVCLLCAFSVCLCMLMCLCSILCSMGPAT